MAQRRLEVLITGNAKDAQKAFGDLERSASKSGKGTTKALSGIQSGLLGLGAGAAAIGAFKAFEESEKIGRQTEAVIKSTGATAQVTADDVGDLASEMSKLGGVDDELVQQGANMLLTFTKVRNEVGKGNDIFDQATLAANNYAAATGTDVVAANKMLGLALNDPIKGLAKLTKAGVTFDDQQKAQIKTMVASGDTLGAQKIILAEFSKEYGGSLEANATASGKAQVAMENLGEAAGEILAPGLEALAGAATAGAEGLSGLPVPAQQAIVGIAGIGTAALVVVPKVVELASTMKDGASAIKNWSSQAGNISRAGAGLGVAAAGVGAFTLTLEALNAASATHTDMAALGTDLEQLADGSASLSDVAGTLDLDIGSLGTTFAKNAETPRDFGDAMGYAATHFKSDTFSTGLRKAQNTVEDLDKAFAGLVTSGNAEKARIAYGQLSLELKNQGFTAEEVAAQLPEYWEAVERSERANKKTAGAVKENETETRQLSRTQEQATKSGKDNAAALAAIRDRAQEATSAIKEFYDEQTNRVASQIDAERALDGITDSVKEHGRELSIDTESGRQNREAIIAAKDAALEYSMQLRDQEGTGAAITAMDQYRQRLYDTLIQSGYTKAQTTALIDEMGLTPTDIWTTFGSNATEAEGKAAAVKKSIDLVPGYKAIRFDALTDEAIYQIALLSRAVNDVGGSVLSGTAGAAIQQSTAARKPSGSRTGSHSRTKSGMSASPTVNPPAPTAGGDSRPIQINITESASARTTAREVAAELNRQSRMGARPLVGANG